MADSGNYGFLTRDGMIPESNSSRKNEYKKQKILNLAFEESDENQKNSLSPTEKTEQSLKLKESNSSFSWWKNIFGGKQRKKKSVPLRRHGSDDNMASHHFLKANSVNRRRSRKCKSEIFEENICFQSKDDLLQQDDTFLSQKTEKQKEQSSNLESKTDEDDDVLYKRENLKDSKTSSERCSSLDKSKRISTHLSMINEESDSFNQEPTLVQRNFKQNPNKPPRKYLSLKEKKPQQHASSSEEDQASKSKMKRSKSLLSLRHLFSKKSKNCKATKPRNLVSESDLKKSASSDDFLHDLNHKLDVMAPENHSSFNIYEKYPGRKHEQQKFLVHIQTREEIPIKDGVPQWDTQSYQYVAHRSKPHASEITARTSSRHSFLESSFIGKSSNSCQVSDVLGSLSHISKSSSTDLILPLEQEIKNRTRERHQVIEAVIHKSQEENEKEVENQIKKEIVQSCESSNEIKLDSDACPSSNVVDLSTLPTVTAVESILHKEDSDNSSFGCSFVLTGVSDGQEKRDSIILKHPYLAEITPLRHMAKCLRQASTSNMPNKLSPIEVDAIDFPPPPDSWTETSCMDTRSDDEKNSETKRNSSQSPFEVFFTPSKKPISNFSLSSGPRRSHSDSDLSSFHVTPMKLNRRYDDRDQTSQSDRSRTSKTKHLLYRMHNRIERLKKLSDSSSNSYYCQGPAFSSANIGTNTLKKSSLLHHNKQTETSLKLFKHLINKNLEKRKLLSQISSESTEEDRLKSAAAFKVTHKQMNSEPIYDYIWPQYESSSTNQVCSESKENNSNSGFPVASCSDLNESSSYCNEATEPTCSSSFLTTGTSHSESILKPVSQSSSNNKELRISSMRAKEEQDEFLNLLSTYNQVENSTFLSSTPTKVNPTFATPVETNTTSNFNEVPSVNDGFHQQVFSNRPFDRDQDPCQDRIKSTILEEMKKISDKYRSTETTTFRHRNPYSANSKFDNWDNELRFQGREIFYEKESPSDSDTASQSTLKYQDSDETSSGDTLTNDVECTNFGSSSLWSTTTKTLNRIPQQHHSVKQPFINMDERRNHVISVDENDARNFMYWDCDETDL